MCGIAGILGAAPQDSLSGRLRAMTDLATHRGPDDAGLALFGEGRALWRSGGSAPPDEAGR